MFLFIKNTCSVVIFVLYSMYIKFVRGGINKMTKDNKTVDYEELFAFFGVQHIEHRELIAFLIKNNSDLSRFMKHYYNGDIFEDIIAFQLYKRMQNRMSLHKYCQLCLSDNVNATETLFQEPLTAYDLELLVSYNLTYEELYKRLVKNPTKSYVSLVKSNPNKSKYNDNFLIQY